MNFRFKTAVGLFFLLSATLSRADRAGDILSAYRRDAWSEAYALAKVIATDGGAGNTDRGIAAFAAYRAGDVDLATSLANERGSKPTGWQLLTAALVKQMEGDIVAAEKLARQAIGDKAAGMDARAFLISLYQSQGLFAKAVPMMDEILRAKPKGYPFDELIPQVSGLRKVYASIKRAPALVASDAWTLPLKTSYPYLTVEVGVNGEDARRFILDTGGSVHPSIGPAVAEELKIEGIGKSAAFGFGGLEDIQVGKIDRLTVGGSTIGPVPVAIVGMLDQLKQFLRVDGVLDTRFLLSHTAKIDIEGKNLIVSNRRMTLKPGLMEGGDTLVAIPFRIIADSKILLPIQLDGKQTWAMFDSGSPIHMFSFDGMKKALDPKEYKIGPSIAGGVGNTAKSPQQITSSKPLRLTIGGRDITIAKPIGQQSLDQQVSHGVGFQLGALLGLELMRGARNFTIDGPARTMYIQFKAPEKEE